MSSKQHKSPYLIGAHRLADILAAIQVMGAHLWDNRPIEHWKDNLGDSPQSANSWEDLFDQHPEFFGCYKGNPRPGFEVQYHLRLRRAYERTFDATILRELKDEEIKELKANNSYDRARLSRRPLAATQVEALMKTAIELQARAAALEDRSKWWLPLASALIGSIFGVAGAILGSLLKK